MPTAAMPASPTRSWATARCDLVVISGPASHLELMWEEPGTAHCFERMASFARLILFDRRGTGLSDAVSARRRSSSRWTTSTPCSKRSARERTALFGASDLGLSALFAATYPDRVTALVLSGVAADGRRMLTVATTRGVVPRRDRAHLGRRDADRAVRPQPGRQPRVRRVVGADAALGGQPRNGAPADGDDHADRSACGAADDPRADAGHPHAAATGWCRSSSAARWPR